MKKFQKLTRAELKNVKGGFGDSCAGKASSTHCRDSNGDDLGDVDGTGCSNFMNNCSKYSNASSSTSTCSC